MEMKDTKTIRKFYLPTESTTYSVDLEFEMFSLEPYYGKHKHNMTRPHRHTFYQILWFSDCCGIHFVDFEPYWIEPNTIFFVAKDQIHHFDDSVPRGQLMHFNDSFLNKVPQNLDICLLYDVYNNLSQGPYVKPVGEDLAQFTKLLTIIEAEYQRRSEFGGNEILGNLVSTFLLLAERIKRLSRKSDSLDPGPCAHLFLRFRALLEQTFKETHSVRDYADALRISAKKLANICQLSTGRSSEEIIKDRILLEAKRLLFHSDMTVQEVAYHLGFNDPYYFTRFFKKNTGHSPRAFRREFYKPRRSSS